MALLTVSERKAIFKELGLGEYNKENIKAFQKKYMFRKSDWDGIYGQNTDNALRTVYYTKVYCKNFSPKEFRCECGGKYCCGFPSYMKPAELIHIQAIRDHYGKPITITSGLRCKTWNSKCGGSIQNSLHMKGLALDFYQQGVTDTLKNRKASVKWIAKQKNHHYTYGNGVYRLTTDKTYSGSVSAPYMGNALHTDTNDNVKPKHPTDTTLVEKNYYDVIDVSDWQGQIDWAKVKADGIVGAIIRYADGTTLDARFKENMENAKANGLHVGSYIFSRAKTKAEAEKEAERLYNACKPYECDMPLYIDLEEASKSKYADTVAPAFLNKMKSLGGWGGVYANLNWWNNYLKNTAKNYSASPFWIAQYNSTMDYKPSFLMGMWQYTSSGKVNGIKGKVDRDKCYTAYWDVKLKETPQDKICAVAKEIADSGKYKYKKFSDEYGKECAICHPHDGANKGWNCIGYPFHCWHEITGCKCSCQVMTDQLYEKLLKVSAEKALEIVRERTGLNDIKVIVDKNGISTDKLKKGDIIAYFDGNDYKHTALYLGDGKIADCTSGRTPNIKYGAKSYAKWKIKEAIRYIGK